MYHFCNKGSVRDLFINHPNFTLVLKDLCETRWAYRFEAIRALKIDFTAVREVLLTIAKGDNREAALEAEGILNKINICDFVTHLIVFEILLGRTNCLSKLLQGKDLDLPAAIKLVNTIQDSLHFDRSNDQWLIIWKQIENFLQRHNIPINNPKLCIRERKLPQKFKDIIVLSAAGYRDSHTSPEMYKAGLYFSAIDILCVSLKERFTGELSDLMIGIRAGLAHWGAGKSPSGPL